MITVFIDKRNSDFSIVHISQKSNCCRNACKSAANDNDMFCILFGVMISLWFFDEQMIPDENEQDVQNKIKRRKKVGQKLLHSFSINIFSLLVQEGSCFLFRWLPTSGSQPCLQRCNNIICFVDSAVSI